MYSIPVDHQRPRPGAFELHPLADPGEERKVVVRIEVCGTFDRCGFGLYFLRQGGQIDQADFVVPGRGDHQRFPVVGKADRPWVGEALIDFIEQHRVFQSLAGDINDAEGVGGDPTAFKLRGGNEKARHQVGGENRFTVGRNLDPAHAFGPVDQRNGFHGLCGGVDHRNGGGDIINIGAPDGNQIGDK